MVWCARLVAMNSGNGCGLEAGGKIRRFGLWIPPFSSVDFAARTTAPTSCFGVVGLPPGGGWNLCGMYILRMVLYFMVSGLADHSLNIRGPGVTKGGVWTSASGFSDARKLRAAIQLCASISAGDAVGANIWRRPSPSIVSMDYVPTFLCSRRAAPLGLTIHASRHPGCTTLRRGTLVGGLALRGL